jgi:RimJ/RimL family protein N-acetyltransferase
MITIRKAKKSDLMFYLELRNEPSIRKASFNDKPIDLAEHTSWFLRKLKDQNSYLFAVQIDGQLAGQVRIDIHNNKAEINIGILPKYRGRGYGSIAIRKSCKRVLTKVSTLDTIFAHIKPDNIASIKSFARARFVEGGDVMCENNKCVEMIYRE